MRMFRDKEVIGWAIVSNTGESVFTKTLNDLMDQYDFVDCQFSTSDNDAGIILYSALVLLAKKTPQSTNISAPL